MSESETVSKLKSKGGPCVGSSGSTATISADDLTALQIITVVVGMNGPLSLTSSSIISSVPVHDLPSKKLDISTVF